MTNSHLLISVMCLFQSIGKHALGKINKNWFYEYYSQQFYSSLISETILIGQDHCAQWPKYKTFQKVLSPNKSLLLSLKYYFSVNRWASLEKRFYVFDDLVARGVYVIVKLLYFVADWALFYWKTSLYRIKYKRSSQSTTLALRLLFSMQNF